MLIYNDLKNVSKTLNILGGKKNITRHDTRTGYVCEEHDNPSDFVLDVLSGNVPNPKDLSKKLPIGESFESWWYVLKTSP